MYTQNMEMQLDIACIIIVICSSQGLQMKAQDL